MMKKGLILLLVMAMLAVSTISYAGPLKDIISRIEKCNASGIHPVVVFDLDGTLFRTDQRQRFIILEWCFKNRDKYPEITKKLEKMDDSICEYRVSDTLKKLGVVDKEVVKSINDFWWKRFFTNIYLMVDKPVKGGANFVNECFKKGATIVYLTGRDVENMMVGTKESLRKNGFPVESKNVVFMLKPDKKMHDGKFKKEAVQKILKLGKVVGLFENQPKNLMLLHKAAPDAIAVFVETNFNPKDKTVLGKEFNRIKEYKIEE